MTKDKKPTYEELEQRLVEAEQMLDALRRGEVDAVLAQEQPIVLRPRELERKLKESETALAEAQALAKVGSWECDVALDQQSWSQEMFRIHGRDPSRGAPNWKGLREHIHPADWPRLGEALQGAMKGRTSYRGEFRVVRPDGATTWIDVIGRTREKQKDGSLKLYGTVQDITERKLVERALAESQEILNRSEEIAKTGGWEFDPATGKQKWTEGTYRIHEVDPDYQPTVEKGLSFFPSPMPTIKYPKLFKGSLTRACLSIWGCLLSPPRAGSAGSASWAGQTARMALLKECLGPSKMSRLKKRPRITCARAARSWMRYCKT